jgi:hypothetical protein
MSNKTYHLKNQEKLQKFIEQQKKKDDLKPNSQKNKSNSRSARTN